jgi:Tol biopolymer transport system component
MRHAALAFLLAASAVLAAPAVLVRAAAATVGAASAPVDVTHWSAPGISSDQFESHAAFDPRGTDLYFVRSTPRFEGWRIFVSHCEATGWSKPESPVFAGDGVEADPWFTPDGRTLYFISTRSTDGVKRKDLDIWRVERAADGKWGTPLRLPEPVNSTAQEWCPRLAPEGSLYFGSGRPGGQGKTDIWRARPDGKGGWTVSNLGPNLNTAGDEYEPLISPDGASMIFMADGGLWESKRTGDSWSPRVKLPPEIDVNGSEIGAAFSPSGNTLLFARDLGGKESGEFFVARLHGKEPWPPPCPP